MSRAMSPGQQDRIMSRGDQAAMGLFMVIGVAFAVFTTVRAVMRVIEVLANHDVRVYAEFAGTRADAPIGPNGAPVSVELDAAALIAPELPAAAVAALVLEQVVVVGAVVTTVACLLVLVLNVLRGRVFSRTSRRLVVTSGFATLVGMALAPFFANMGANGAFARISDQTFDNVVMSVDIVPLLAVAFVAALAAFIFGMGDRLQRDTEGLV